MEPVDAFGGSDPASMAADNTSAFNCRNAVAPGPPRWSAHAYGEAIDVNTVENPYVEGGDVQPDRGLGVPRSFGPSAAAWRIRGGALVSAFAAVGWPWGGRWSDPDYQHFSATGGYGTVNTVTARIRGGIMVALVAPRQPFIDGKYVNGDGPALAVENPATEATIAEVETASTEQIEQAIGAARRSFDAGVWSETPARERAAVVRRMAEYLAERRDLLVDTVIAEAGAPYENATTIQVGAALEHAATIPDLYLELAQQEYNPVPPTGHTPAGSVAVSMNVYEPVGVVSAISAYNFPFYLNVWKTLPALMAGCSVVLRPSPLTPLSAMLFGEAADAAGLPPGVLNVVIDQAIEGGKLITTHPAVDMVTFTGSTQVGREIMAQAASTVPRVHRCPTRFRRSRPHRAAG